MDREFVEDLVLFRNGITRVGENEYVENSVSLVNGKLRNRYGEEVDMELIPSLNDFDEEVSIKFDFDNLKYLASSYNTTFILVDKDTFSLKVFTKSKPNEVFDLYWNVADFEDYVYLNDDFMLYESLAIEIEKILKHKYGCREYNIEIIEGFYTRYEVLEMFEDAINH